MSSEKSRFSLLFCLSSTLAIPPLRPFSDIHACGPPLFLFDVFVTASKHPDQENSSSEVHMYNSVLPPREWSSLFFCPQFPLYRNSHSHLVFAGRLSGLVSSHMQFAPVTSTARPHRQVLAFHHMLSSFIRIRSRLFWFVVIRGH